MVLGLRPFGPWGMLPHIVPSLDRELRARALAAAVIALLWAPRLARADDPPATARGVAEIRITAVPPIARAGEHVEVTVALLDARGAPVDAPTVSLGSLHGQVDPLRRIAPGIHRADFTAPKVLPRLRSALLYATAGGNTAERPVALAPGPAALVEISTPVAARAGSRMVYVTIRDAHGNGADDELRARATAGPLPARRVGPGEFVLEYRPDPAADEDVIVVEAGAARASQPLQLTSDAARFTVAPWAGVALGHAVGVAAGATGSAWLGQARDDLGLLLDVGFWMQRQTDEVALPGRTTSLEGERSYFPVTASAAWSHQLGRGWSTLAGVGGGAALVLSSQQLEGQAAVSELGWATVAALSAGVGWRAGGGVAFLEARAVFVGDAHLQSLAGDSRVLLLAAGYRFDAR